MELQQQNGRNISCGPNAVELNNVTSSWSASQEHATLDSVSLCFKTNQICAVIGPVGCGKVIHFYILFDKEKNKKWIFLVAVITTSLNSGRNTNFLWLLCDNWID